LFKTSYSVIGLQEKVRKVILSKSAYKNIISIVESCYPKEACGVMFGKIKESTAIITEVIKIKNVLESSYRFWFDVIEWMDIILKAKKRNLEYIGLFHSHPKGSPIPSLADRHRMLECPEEIWIIVSYTPDSAINIAAWRIDDWGSSITRLLLTVA